MNTSVILSILCILSILSIFVLCIFNVRMYDKFANVNTNTNTNPTINPDYPCKVYLSDNDFIKHMIPHHQMAIDISIQHIKTTQNDIIMKLLRELIWTQKNEIIIMLAELNNKTENISEINNNNNNNKAFIPTMSSLTYPNTIGLTNTFCDPAFFTSMSHQNHNPQHKILTDREYILHMIPHHQVAVNMCKILLKHTKSDFLIDLAYKMIRGQESEIMLLNDLLESPFVK